jgi:alkylation response protein AidB-like acyl-CoA dehydrogenase
VVPESARLGADGEGFAIMMGAVLPAFNLMTAAFSVGLMEGAIGRAVVHASASRFGHLDSSLADLPTVRAYIARMRIGADMARMLLVDAIDAVEVLATAMRVSGGAAYRREVGLGRYFRDAQASSVMAPTTDQLYDFIGKAVCGLPLF